MFTYMLSTLRNTFAEVMKLIRIHNLSRDSRRGRTVQGGAGAAEHARHIVQHAVRVVLLLRRCRSTASVRHSAPGGQGSSGRACCGWRRMRPLGERRQRARKGSLFRTALLCIFATLLRGHTAHRKTRRPDSVREQHWMRLCGSAGITKGQGGLRASARCCGSACDGCMHCPAVAIDTYTAAARGCVGFSAAPRTA